jgi:4-hydroxybenzoate polyprenyltransferase
MPFALIGFFLGLIDIDYKFFGAVTWNLNKSIGWEPDQPILWHQNTLVVFILVIICMVLARSAAMSFNRYLDRNFDAANPRTAIREIPKGIISANSALTFTVISSFLFMIACYFINSICFFLSPVALFVVLGYSYTKRFTPLCHLILGLGLSLAPIGAYLAVTGSFSLLAIIFSLTVIFWVSGFDIIYSLQDEEFDKSQNLYSLPAAFGKSRSLRISELLHFLSAACVIIAGIYGKFGLLYWIGVTLFIGMLVYQHSLVKPNDLRKVNIAFMTANGIASVVFAVFVIADLFVH